MARILLAGLVGGIIIFVWGFVSHEMLPVGKMGYKELPNADSIVATLKSSLDGPAVY